MNDKIILSHQIIDDIANIFDIEQQVQLFLSFISIISSKVLFRSLERKQKFRNSLMKILQKSHYETLN